MLELVHTVTLKRELIMDLSGYRTLNQIYLFVNFLGFVETVPYPGK